MPQFFHTALCFPSFLLTGSQSPLSPTPNIDQIKPLIVSPRRRSIAILCGPLLLFILQNCLQRLLAGA